MMLFLLAPENKPFAVALMLMLLISLLEGITTILGVAASNLLESLLPDLGELPEGEVDFEGGHGSPSSLSRVLGWLRIGEVPILILFIIFLSAFGLIGVGLQSFSSRSFGFFMPVWAATLFSLGASFPLVRICGGFLARYMPGDETYAVSSDTFIGRVAVVTLGKAAPGSPAEAKLRDLHGQTHYIMVEPDGADETFEQNSRVLLVSREGAVFKGTRNMSDALLDNDQ